MRSATVRDRSSREGLRLITPARRVGAFGGRFEHVGSSGFQDALGEGETAIASGGAGRAGVAMRLIDAVIEGGVGMRIGGGIESVLHVVDGGVEVIGVRGADHDVQLALKLGAQGFPIALHDGGEVIVLAPVGGDFVIDDAGALIPDFGGIAVGADGAEDGLPDVPLLAGAAMSAKDKFPAIGAFGGGEDDAGRSAHFALGDAAEGADGPVGVFVVVNVDALVGVKIHGIGTSAPSAVEVIGIEDLRGESFPAAGAAAVNGAGPSLADASKLFFDGGDKFTIDGFAVRADVGGIDGVGVIVVGIGVLDEEEQHARELAGGPVLIKLKLRLGALEGEAGHAGVRRRGAEAGEVAREMAVIHEKGIAGVGMGSPAFGKDHDGAEVHGLAPEFCKDLALHANVLDPFGVFGRRYGGDEFGEMDLKSFRGGGIEMDFFGDAIEVAGLGVPVLPFAFVHRELDGVAVGAMEGGVFVQDALDPILAGGNVAEIGGGIAESVVGDDGGLAG